MRIRRVGLRILSEHGHPTSPHIEEALLSLVPRFLRHFPQLRDDSAFAEVLEEAARKVSHREEKSGPIERLHAYAWVVLRSVAVSRLRRGPAALSRRTLASEEGEEAMRSIPSRLGSPAEIERRVLFRQVLSMLSPEERLVCAWKRAGFSSREIARHRGTTTAAIDKLLSRARERVRASLSSRSSEEVEVSGATRSGNARQRRRALSGGKGTPLTRPRMAGLGSTPRRGRGCEPLRSDRRSHGRSR
jgi:RNA polymerase sigma factor (sigma-70 family)